MKLLFFDFDYVQAWAQCGSRMTVAPSLGGSATCQRGSSRQQGTTDSFYN